MSAILLSYVGRIDQSLSNIEEISNNAALCPEERTDQIMDLVDDTFDFIYKEIPADENVEFIDTFLKR